MESVVAVLVAGLCLLWILGSLQALRLARAIPVLETVTPPSPESWPRLSIVIAACNEADTIGPTLQSLLRQDYPSFEIIVVDDRSTDGTPAVIDALAQLDARIRPLRIDVLPSGWLGKVHALQRGSERADGDWLLFTDADVLFAPGALTKTMSLVLQRATDHLAVLPKQITSSFWLDVTLGAFGAIFLQQTRALELETPGGRGFIGSGGFNLVRRAALAQTPGFEWLRMEVVDDVGLGLMLKRCGFTTTLAISTDLVAVAWYHSLAGMVRGLEKNSFLASARGSLLRLLLLTTFIPVYVAAPFVALFYPTPPFLWLLGVATLVTTVTVSLFSARCFKLKPLPAVLSPLGFLIIVAILVRSAYQCLKRGGIDWRGTFYPLKTLKQQQRVKL